MIRKSGEYTVENRPCGGSSDIFEVRHRFTCEEMFGKTRLFSEIVFEPGFVLPMHAHQKDVEIFYVMEGELVSIDGDGGEAPFVTGDYMITGGGGRHGLRNDSGKRARILAVIIN